MPTRKPGINATARLGFEVTSLYCLYAQARCAYALLSDSNPHYGDTRIDWNATMNDLTAVGLLLACLIATLGLVRVCDWLRPHAPAPRGEKATGNSGLSDLTKEAHQ